MPVEFEKIENYRNIRRLNSKAVTPKDGVHAAGLNTKSGNAYCTECLMPHGSLGMLR